MSILRVLFGVGKKDLKVIPFNQMTPETHDQISSGLAKLMFVVKSQNMKLTKAQQNYILNQAKQVQEFEDRYLTGIKDKFGNVVKKESADVLDLKGIKLDPNKPIMGGTQELQSGIMKATESKPTVVKTEAQIKKEIEKQNKEAVKNWKDKMKDPEDLAGGGLAGMLGEPTYQDENHRVPLNKGLLVPREKPSGEEANKILWDKKLNLLKELKGGVGRRVWLNMINEHLNDGLKQGVISKKQFNSAIMPLFGEAGETQTSALEKDDTLSMGERMDIYGKDREDYPAYLLAGGGRVPYGEGGSDPLVGGRSLIMSGQVLPEDFDELDPDELLHIIKLLQAGQIPNLAEGGRVPFSKGKLAGLEAALKQIMEKFGKKSITTASKLERPLKVIEKEKTKKMFDDFNNKIATQEALSKGTKKMAGPIKHKKTGPLDFLESTDATTWLQQEKFFNPKALDMYGKKVPANWIEVEKKAAQKLIDDLGPLDVSPNHPNYKDMKAIRQSAKDRLASIKITEALGGNITMHDWLRMNRKNLKMSDYIKKPGAKKVVDELSGIKKAFVQKKSSPWFKDPKTLTPEEELRREFPGISDDLINQILIDDNPQRIAEAKAAMKEALKMQEKGMGVDEIIDIFKKQGKKPTKHASGGLARMLGE